MGACRAFQSATPWTTSKARACSYNFRAIEEVRRIDPAFDLLYKTWLNARVTHRQAFKEYGPFGPLTRLAAEQEESTQKAWEDRLIFLRAQGQQDQGCPNEALENASQDTQAYDQSLWDKRMASHMCAAQEDSNSTFLWIVVLFLLWRDGVGPRGFDRPYLPPQRVVRPKPALTHAA